MSVDWASDVLKPSTPCQSYRPGHCTHWIPPLRIHAQAPRHPISQIVVSDGWVTFTDHDGVQHRWWNHDRRRIAAHLKSRSHFVRIGESMFLAAASPLNPGSWAWFYCASAPSDCRPRCLRHAGYEYGLGDFDRGGISWPVSRCSRWGWRLLRSRSL
jgi:hypothetical protein